MSFEERFQQAGKDGKEFRGAPFWSWNDDLDPNELRRQVRSMCESGMGGFFMHARAGLITPYNSQEYFDCHTACIDEAKKLGMGAWLYDEDCWPSGSGGGVSWAKGPFYQSKQLVMEKVIGGHAKSTENTIAVFTYTEQPAETPGGEATITDFHRVEPLAMETMIDKNLLHFYWTPQGYVDVLSDEAIAQFIDNTHEAFAKLFSSDFGGVVPGIFTDEPNYRAIPWTLDLAQEFKARMGYDITDQLVQVFHNVADWRKARHDFWKVVTQLYLQAFSKQIYDWCEEHKLKLTGHYLCEDDLNYQIRTIGAAMPHYEYEQLPGIDHLCRRIADPILPKQVSSAAHQFGGRRVLSEMFGCSGWNMSFEDQKWIAEWQYVLGVNLMCQHLALYSLKGWRKRDYPPSINYQQPWWTQYNVVEDHFARLACALTSGKHVADVLLIHPIESAWADFGFAEEGGGETVKLLNADFVSVSEYLQQFHVDYDYGDESIMERHASIENNQVKVGEATYNLVVLPRMTTIRRSTLDLLAKWIDAGGRIIVCGGIPEMIDGVASGEPAEVLKDQRVVNIDFEAVKEAVLDVIEPRVQVLDEYGSDAITIFFQQRDLGGKQLFFFANIDNVDAHYDSAIRFRGSGKVEEWNLDTGDIVELPCTEIGGYTVIERRFVPTQSVLLSFDTSQQPLIAEPQRWMATDEQEIAGPWTLQRNDPNSITLDFCKYKVGDGEFTEPIPTIWLGARLSDIEEPTPVTLRYTFTTQFAEVKQRSFTLAMERPDAYEILVNGHRISYVDTGWWCDNSFKKIDIGLYVQPGENVIEMTCDYLGGKGRIKRQNEIDIPSLWKRMWTNPPADVKDPILIPYSGEVADKIKEYNYLKMGLDLESIYIVGDFAVYQTQPGTFVLKDEQTQTGDGDLANKGFCFYRGTLTYEGSFSYENQDEDKLMLSLDKIGGIIARVSINGQDAGTLQWRPLELDVTKFVKPGDNDIKIEITNSCRNLLGPHHDYRGELFNVGPFAFGAEAGYAAMPGSGRGQERLQEWTDAYSFVETGLVTSPKLVYMRKQ